MIGVQQYLYVHDRSTRVWEYKSSRSSEYAVEYIQEYLQYAMSTVITVITVTTRVLVAGVVAEVSYCQ